MIFKWSRPENILYPNVWLKFQAKDIESDDLIEYSVEDLTEDRFSEAITIMATEFLANAPLSKSKNAANDAEYVEDIVKIWTELLKQRMTNVCYKEGSPEIVGLNFNYVASKDDESLLGDSVKSKSLIQIFKVWKALETYGNFNVFERYGVNEYLSSLGMYVPKKFAGRKIGEKLLEASKQMAIPCNLKFRHALFTSNISNKIADNLGYKTDVELSFEEIRRMDPSLGLENIESSKATLRTWIF